LAALGHRELLALLGALAPRLEQLSPFELLDVPPPSNDTDIQRAFHQRAAQLHPDLYRTMAALSRDDREQLEMVYSRIAQAYMTLRDPNERSLLLQRTARTTEPAKVPMAPKAQALYRRAQAALGTGDVASAVLNLKMALAAHPDHPLLRAALAEAQSRLPPRR
jgi:tetratricopeptide (TPR) repeat protein